jgi:hypothetical protein
MQRYCESALAKQTMETSLGMVPIKTLDKMVSRGIQVGTLDEGNYVEGLRNGEYAISNTLPPLWLT